VVVTSDPARPVHVNREEAEGCSCQSGRPCSPSRPWSWSPAAGARPPALAPPPLPTAASGQGVHVSLTDFKIAPADIAVPGGAATLNVSNDGKTPHNLAIRDQSGKVVGHTDDLRPGQAAVLTVTLPVGTYTTFCSLPGHESLGMRGTLMVP